MGAGGKEPAVPRMTYCACAEMSFEQIARRAREIGGEWRQACRELGVGVTCTACVPDLAQYMEESARRTRRSGKGKKP
jgi:bacterioferritin-associated ferredoxin